MYFSATIFALVGFSSPTLASLSVAITNFLMTLVAFRTIDSVGRRRILLYSIPAMVVGLSLAAMGFGFLDIQPTSEDPSSKGFALGGSDDRGERPWAIVILCAMVIYVAGYAVGLGCVPWQQSE
jgi:MFS transporter, SP family, solute carrier family 2 (myo-inositol transporter), member 13